MTIKSALAVILTSLVIAACGGGGGSAGTTSGSGGSASSNSSTSTGTVSATTTSSLGSLSLTLVDASGTSVAGNSITPGAVTYAQVVLKDGSGAPVANKLVTFLSSSTNLVFSPASGQVLTNSNGIAKVAISPATATIAGAGSISAGATLPSGAVSSSIDVQSSAANVTLSSLVALSNPISALQSSAVTVQVNVNGTAAAAGAVAVNFTQGCGTFSPASALTGSGGIATSTYQSNATCSGAINIGASASGASAISGLINITAVQPANIIFNSASPILIVASSAPSGTKTSVVKFQVVDANGAGLSGQAVSLSLASAAGAAGVTFSTGSGTSTAAQIVSSDSSGYASVIVVSGGLPTPVIINASLVSISGIVAASSGIAVTSGKATQNAMSLSAAKLSTEAFNVDGVQNQITIRVADRQGNPVPLGTVVNFVTGYGLVTGTCTLDASSQCTVIHTSQGSIRGYNNAGRVAILAYMDGEESFIDQNGNNIWDSTEPFYDMGTAFRDDNENGVYDAATEQSYPGGSVGTASCASNPYSFPSIANTCDGTWSGSIRLRRQIVVVWATSQANITATSGSKSPGPLIIKVADLNGNAMPTGTTVAAAVTTAGSTCAITSVSPAIITNSTNPTSHSLAFNHDPTCGAASVDVTVTSPSGVVTIKSF